MDQLKAGASRRRRLASTPGLESLEGRRLMAAQPLAPGVREITTNGATELIITGTNRADTITISDNGTGAAGNVTVTSGTGATYTSVGPIAMIQVIAKGGNDQVTYNL